MDHAIISLLFLLVTVALVNMQVIYDPVWGAHTSIVFKNTNSSVNIQERKIRDTGNSSRNDNYTISTGVEVGICLNITMKKEVKYETKRKSTLNYVPKPGCMSKNMLDCFEPRPNFIYEIVPVEHSVKVRTPFCCEGYEQVESRNSPSSEESSAISRSWPDGDIYCKPICDPSCINGYCIFPNKCKCPKEMVLMEDNRTCGVPKCEPDCVNADCVGHNNCKCHRLYVKDSADPSFCVPHCAVACKKNSYCYLPNECRCKQGYRRNATTEQCEPVCQLGCVNGFCSGANDCACYDGFQKVVGSNNKCEPKCEGCNNGVCTAPNVCQCNDKYEYNETTKNCSPKCPKDCERGCDTPMQCRGCAEGYKIKEGSLDCEPKCEGCDNGICTAPGVCTCNYLYKYNETTKHCTPDCPEDCTRGCVTPMQCRGCEEGYKMKNGSLDCEPECVGCKNGKCFAPGVCICKEGYSRDLNDTECVPKCEPGCKNAVCSAPKTCTCFKGYHLVSENICESDTESCRRSIENEIKLDKNSCVNLHEPLKMFTENCSAHFANNSCFDEICSSENHAVCSMQYICEIVNVPTFTTLQNHTSQLQCRWRNRKVMEIKTRVGFESSTSMSVNDLTTNMQYDNLPLHFFRPDFDLNPCLLCLCPVNETRKFCMNESYAFKLCSCVSEKAAVIMRDSENGFLFHRHNHIFHYIVFAVALLLFITALVALKRKYDTLKNDAKTYAVSSFSNDLYCEGNKFEEAEHVYAEIECDAYEQPRNIVLKFD